MKTTILNKLMWLSVLAVVFCGCTKDMNSPTQGDDPAKLRPSDNFDWNTTKQVPLNVVAEDGSKLAIFVYDGKDVIAAGYTPFNEKITISKSCRELMVATGPLPYSYIKGYAVRSQSEDMTVAVVAAGDSRQVSVTKQKDLHDDLYEQWPQWKADGKEWKEFVAWWNESGGALGHSSITVYANQPPTYDNQGTLSIPHTCHDNDCPWYENAEAVDADEDGVYSSLSGTYIFEDLFPSMGDYDMNDMVLSEVVSRKVLGNNGIKDLELTYTIKAAGSTKVLAMAVQLLGITPADVKELTLTRFDETGAEIPYVCANTSGMFSLDAKGLEIVPYGTVVIPLFDNFFDLIPASAVGFGFNTVAGGNGGNGGKGEPLVFKIYVKFQNSNVVSLSDFSTDVFIMTRGVKEPVSVQRGNEIHVADAPYTAYMNTALFNTGDDASNAPEKCFRAKNGYVWAIYFPFAQFNHPLEGIHLDAAYPRFINWIETNGEDILYQNWYKYPERGLTWEY